jgi:hypothetical protein
VGRASGEWRAGFVVLRDEAIEFMHEIFNAAERSATDCLFPASSTYNKIGNIDLGGDCVDAMRRFLAPLGEEC